MSGNQKTAKRSANNPGAERIPSAFESPRPRPRTAGSPKHVLLLGATGMLGSAIYGVLKDRYKLVLAVRDLEKVRLLDDVYGGTSAHQCLHFDAAELYREYAEKKGAPGPVYSDFVEQVGPIDRVINAIGVTIPFTSRDPALTLFVNGALPHILARTFGERMIHVTTDCVYSGAAGYPYDENSPKSPVDLYGLSKSLGEPLDCLTIRTSIFGRELSGFTGLLEWFLQQEGKSIVGFANHYWNGITTQQFGVLCDTLMSAGNGFPKRGVFHVFSTPVSKYEMLRQFQAKYAVRCQIARDASQSLNRCLSSVKALNASLNVPSFDRMLADLRP